MDDITEILHKRGFRVTPQRLLILEVLREHVGHMSPVDLSEIVKARMPSVTEATIYRTLNFLADQKIITASHIGGGQLVYEMGGYAHHHLVCRSCGHGVEISDEIFQELFNKILETSGFQVDIQHLTLLGKCPDCRSTELEK